MKSSDAILFRCKPQCFDQIRQEFSHAINLLCIEDSEEICNILCGGFFCSGIFNNHRVFTFETAKRSILSSQLYHCWLLDLSLQRHNDALPLLELKPGFPFCIVLSASLSLEDANEAMQAGASSVHAKNRVILSEAAPFIAEVCASSALSFLLKGRRPHKFEIFNLLQKEFVPTWEEWAFKACINPHTLRMLCDDFSGITAHQFLRAYHALYSALIFDCLSGPMAGNGKSLELVLNRIDFYTQCAEFVLEHLDKVYRPLYLKS